MADLEAVIEHVLAIARAELQAAEELHQLLVNGADVRLADGLPCRTSMMCFSISFCVSITTSSMRVGWMRPSWISLPSEMRAISRRTLSNALTMTTPGRVVDDDVDAGRLFEGADVATLRGR